MARPKSLTPGDEWGTEGITPEEIGDGDYGRLLDRAYAAVHVKGWRPQRDVHEWVHGRPSSRAISPRDSPRYADFFSGVIFETSTARPECQRS